MNNRPKPKRPSRWPARGLVVIVLVLLALIFGPWVGEAFVWVKEVDIHSGDIRERRTVLGIIVSQRIEESWLSRWTEAIGEPDWRVAVSESASFHSISPHYRYHGTPNQIRELELFDQMFSLEEDARRHLAHRVLELWQEGHYRPADEYLSQVWQRLRPKLDQPPKAVTVEDVR